VVLAWCGVEPHKVRPDVVLDNPAFASLPAVVSRRVFCVPEAWLGSDTSRSSIVRTDTRSVLPATTVGASIRYRAASPEPRCASIPGATGRRFGGRPDFRTLGRS